ncbi:trimeric intracellular cation channel family protein [Paenibacillus filicis]|uniref:Trimeric intracellular cation channel family protein n=1 Tax=Paenibacillus gyeongsangnamensis TaxID=3388067 RepID=A0ABT4QAU3_9BACL|nr:trimeric intracellular cation channel family protein [Paenibacillus filicis]MCZ8513961.1 trimeric intracellular cation channel family protein [Paenibacillus filicis]
MSWIVLHVLGIMAYAATGAMVAMEAEYSIIGVFVLGFTTSFGGAIIRNVIIEAPVSGLWDSFTIAIVLATLTLIVLLPSGWMHHWRRWGLFFDSIGLASFALQGALAAKQVHDHASVLLLSAMFTGLGGGMIRDLLAGRKPLALKEEIHAVLALLCGGCVWLGWTSSIQLTFIVLGAAGIRMLAIRYRWSLHLPGRLNRTFRPLKTIK